MVFDDTSEIVNLRSFPHLVSGVVVEGQVCMIDGQVAHDDSAEQEENNEETHAGILPLNMLVSVLVHPQVVAHHSEVATHLDDTAGQECP